MDLCSIILSITLHIATDCSWHPYVHWQWIPWLNYSVGKRAFLLSMLNLLPITFTGYFWILVIIGKRGGKSLYPLLLPLHNFINLYRIPLAYVSYLKQSVSPSLEYSDYVRVFRLICRRMLSREFHSTKADGLCGTSDTFPALSISSSSFLCAQ